MNIHEGKGEVILEGKGLNFMQYSLTFYMYALTGTFLPFLNRGQSPVDFGKKIYLNHQNWEILMLYLH